MPSGSPPTLAPFPPRLDGDAVLFAPLDEPHDGDVLGVRAEPKLDPLLGFGVEANLGEERGVASQSPLAGCAERDALRQRDTRVAAADRITSPDHDVERDGPSIGRGAIPRYNHGAAPSYAPTIV